jgi:hypothetical protein
MPESSKALNSLDPGISRDDEVSGKLAFPDRDRLEKCSGVKQLSAAFFSKLQL